METILDALLKKCSGLAYEAATTVLGVKDEIEKLLLKMESIRCVLEDAEKKRYHERSIHLWLCQLKDVLYDADDLIDLCMIKGNQLLAHENSQNEEIFRVRCIFFSIFTSISSICLRYRIGKRIKDLNDRLQTIYENRTQFNLQQSSEATRQVITLVNTIQTSPLIDTSLVVGVELEVATNDLVNLLTAEKAEEKCCLFAIAGMGGIGKTTLAQNIFNHQKIKGYFNSKVWICVSQTYKETELLEEVIRGLKGNCGNSKTKAELLSILRDSFASCWSLFLVLDDVWRADVWLELLSIPLQNTNSSVRVLITTRYADDVAKAMQAEHIHNVRELSIVASWDMLRRLLFKDSEQQQANDLKELGLQILKKCRGLPLAIKAIAGVLGRREKTKTAWEQILRSDTWSVRDLHENHIASLHLSYEDLTSHLKQCFLYFSLCREDVKLSSREFARLWVAEGFLTENQGNSLMEDVAESYFHELLGRNLLLPISSNRGAGTVVCKMHDIVRSLAIFLSKEETSCGVVNVRNPITFTKLRRLSVEDKNFGVATKIFDLVAKNGALRTLLAKWSDLVLDDKRLRQLSCLRVLEIGSPEMKKLPESIGDLVHLRYLDLRWAKIEEIPESIKNLAYLQFLNLRNCNRLKQLPNGITQLHNLRYLNLRLTDIRFMPKGIEKLQQLNRLRGFPVDSMDSSSKLVDLNSLKQLRSLRIENLKEDQSDVVFLEELPHLSKLTLKFSFDDPAELFDNIIPPRSLKTLKICFFDGHRFSNWMSSFENHIPNLTVLELQHIECWTQLPRLGQLRELRKLTIYNVVNVMRIGQELLGDGVVTSTTRIAFPKLDEFSISHMDKLEDWSFGAQVEETASPRLKLLPCLHKLKIKYLKLLKHLPKGLKYSAMKSLSINTAQELKSLDDLPPEIEKLKLCNNRYLEKVCQLAMLKNLHICRCPSLSSVKKLDSLQRLHFEDEEMESLPVWVLIILRQRVLQNNTNKDFLLELLCTKKVIQECLKGGSYWDLIQHIPRVTARVTIDSRSYFRYEKQPYVYDTNM